MKQSDLVVHDGAETHDAHMDVVLLADESGVLQSAATWQRVGASHQRRAAEKHQQRSAWRASLEGCRTLPVLPDGVACCSGRRRRRGGKAAVAMEVLYGPAPGRVDGRHLSSGLRLLAIKPSHNV